MDQMFTWEDLVVSQVGKDTCWKVKSRVDNILKASLPKDRFLDSAIALHIDILTSEDTQEMFLCVLTSAMAIHRAVYH